MGWDIWFDRVLKLMERTSRMAGRHSSPPRLPLVSGHVSSRRTNQFLRLSCYRLAWKCDNWLRKECAIRRIETDTVPSTKFHVYTVCERGEYHQSDYHADYPGNSAALIIGVSSPAAALFQTPLGQKRRGSAGRVDVE